MQTDYVQGSAQHAGDISIETGAAQSQFLQVFSSDRDHEATVALTLLLAQLSVNLCENVPPVTIFGNFCVIWTLLKKVELFLTEVGPAPCESDTWKQTSHNKQAAGDGRRRAFRVCGQARNKLVCFQKCL